MLLRKFIILALCLVSVAVHAQDVQGHTSENTLPPPVRDDSLGKTDVALMLAVHAGEQPVANLKGTGLKVYKKACDMVKAAKAKNQSDYDIALHLHNQLIKNGKYAPGDRGDNPAANILGKKKGGSEDYACTYYMLCSMAGIESRIVYGTTDNHDHAWNLLCLDGVWTHADCTQGIPQRGKKMKKGRKGAVYYEYFGAHDHFMASTHKWTRGEYPACTETQFWHVRQNAPHYTSIDELVEEVAKEGRAEDDGIARGFGHTAEMNNPPERIEGLVAEAVEKHCEGPRAYRWRYQCYGSLLLFRVAFKKK